MGVVEHDKAHLCTTDSHAETQVVVENHTSVDDDFLDVIEYNGF